MLFIPGSACSTVRRVRFRCVQGGMAGVLSCLVAGSALAADSQTITFHITVPAVTCTVAPDDVTVSSDIDGRAFVGKDWQTGGETDLQVVLSNCGGAGQPGQSPRLTISPAGSTTVLAGSSNFLFRDSTSTSTGFGVAIFSKAAADITRNATTDMVASGGTAWTGTAGSAGSALNQTITLATGIACGPASDCTASSLQAGNLKASITFNLVYN